MSMYSYVCQWKVKNNSTVPFELKIKIIKSPINEIYIEKRWQAYFIKPLEIHVKRFHIPKMTDMSVPLLSENVTFGAYSEKLCLNDLIKNNKYTRINIFL